VAAAGVVRVGDDAVRARVVAGGAHRAERTLHLHVRGGPQLRRSYTRHSAKQNNGFAGTQAVSHCAECAMQATVINESNSDSDKC
jgi:hypothetical protein